MDEAELLKKILEVFWEEASEHLSIIGNGLVELEKKGDITESAELLENIYRSAHSMKGASRAVNLLEIEKICQSLEGCFSKLKKGELQLSSRIFDILHSVINNLEKIIESQERPEREVVQYLTDLLDTTCTYQTSAVLNEDRAVSENGRTHQEHNIVDRQNIEVEDEKDDLKNLSSANSDTVYFNPESEKKNVETDFNKHAAEAKKETVRLSTKVIDDIYFLVEESLQIKLSQIETDNSIKSVIKEIDRLKRNWIKLNERLQANKRVSDKNKNSLIPQAKIAGTYDLLDTINEEFNALNKQIASLETTSKYTYLTTEYILENLNNEIKSILMLPFFNLFDGFPRMVRELAKDLNKDVIFSVKGANIEVDRRIMEVLKDPIIHIIRNAIDHGIEKPEVRRNSQKDSVGKIEIEIYQIDGNNIQIIISDDGAGIQKKEVIEKAIKDKIITRQQASKLNKDDINKLIFRSGFSTSLIVSDVSGRGLGLAIVEEKIENIGGKLLIESEEGQGCKFILTVPATMTKAQGLHVRIGTKYFILPTGNIIETLRIKSDSIKKIENQDTIHYNGAAIGIVKLGMILGINQLADSKDGLYRVIIVEWQKNRIGFIVDEIISEMEVLFKPLNYPVKNLKNVAGISLLGNGEICPILNNQDLVKSALQMPSALTPSATKRDQEKKTTKFVLLSEDSITSRLFLKNILEGAGYKVKAVVDGVEALIALKQDNFDILISDVEMPRMNGFELTEAVRKDKRFSNLPVILVTSLNKREHQEKGIEVGANAYIVKSSFERSNLLETIKRFI